MGTIGERDPVGPALGILRKQLNGEDPKLAMRAAGVLLRFATPSRLLPSTTSAQPVDEDERYVDDLLAYVNGRPGQAEQDEDKDEED